jgi:chemotaxis regulatin CheY-phosphate phosphatase CheZ
MRNFEKVIKEIFAKIGKQKKNVKSNKKNFSIDQPTNKAKRVKSMLVADKSNYLVSFIIEHTNTIVLTVISALKIFL